MARWGKSKNKTVGGLLREAAKRIERGYPKQALSHAEQALRRARTPAEQTAARRVLAEAHLQAAFDEPELAARLDHLDVAVTHDAEDAPTRFYHALVQAQLGRYDEARATLGTLTTQPDAPATVAYVQALCELARKKKPGTDALAPPQANALRLIRALLDGDTEAATDVLAAPLPGTDVAPWSALAAFVSEDPEAAMPLEHAAKQAEAPPIAQRLRYYQGAALMRQGDQDAALKVWKEAAGLGTPPPGLEDNLGNLLRAEVIADAAAGRWQEVADAAGRLPEGIEDRILFETLGLAYFHLGHDAARAGKWPAAIDAWERGARYNLTRHLAQNLALALEAAERWAAAADAWRDMVRRRPRKASHPDYLTDAQVAALWGRAARNYLRSDRPDAVDEALRCLDTALKYAPDDADLRLQRADLLIEAERDEAAENELERILKRDPDHVEALMRLAVLVEEGRYYWRRDPLPIWRRALEAAPDHPEVRDGLAQSYLKKVMPDGPFGSMMTPGEKVKLLKTAVKELPEHPMIHVAMGLSYQEKGDSSRALEHVERAWEHGRQEVVVAGTFLTLLLLLGEVERIEAALPDVRKIQGLLPDFWISQGRMALDEDVPDWARRFFDEAEALVGQAHVKTSKARVLVRAHELAYEGEADDLAAHYEARIRDEVPRSGAVEFMEAYLAWQRDEGERKVLSLLRKAARRAGQAGDESLAQLAKSLEMQITMPAPLDLFRALMGGKDPF